jgi:hypothetical protein
MSICIDICTYNIYAYIYIHIYMYIYIYNLLNRPHHERCQPINLLNLLNLLNIHIYIIYVSRYHSLALETPALYISIYIDICTCNTYAYIYIYVHISRYHSLALETHCFFFGAEPFPGRIDASPAQTQVLL